MQSKIMLPLVTLICVLSSWLLALLYKEILKGYDSSGTILVHEFSWFFRLFLNLVGYSTVLVPMFIMYKYLERTNYFEKLSNSTAISRLLSCCYHEPGERLPEAAKVREAETSSTKEGAELLFCFFGLMGAYLVWGLLQEKIMTQNYVMPDGSLTKFNDSQFLVFINRLAAFAVASVQLSCRRTAALPPAPLYKFSYCSLTNVVSAWCQYEALKYVNFPTQVLSKSCKIIPVMLMGRLLSGNSYRSYEYVTAGGVSLGMLLFMLGSQGHYSASTVMSMSGVILLCLYLVCDSFTSSWQHALFTRYGPTSIQMMCYVNIFSCLLPGAALLQNPNTAASLALLQHPVFLCDVLLLSVSSTLGQLLIYRTIARFGAVLFTIIMTLRQAVSILLSCLVYGHAVSVSGCLGIVLVFSSVLLRVYCAQRAKRRRKPAAI